MKWLVERLFQCNLDARIKHIWLTPFVLVTWHEDDWLGSGNWLARGR